MSSPVTSSPPHRSLTTLQGERPTGIRKPGWTYAFVGLGAALFFYLHLFHFPVLPILHGGDQFDYLEHAERMLHGEVLYRDLFQFNLPGTEYLYYILFRCFGVHLWIGNLALLLADTAVTLLTYSLSRLVLRGAAALLPVIAFLAICQRTSMDGSHHWYSTMLILLAINLIVRARNSVWLAIAGAVLGLATLFTSTLGVSVAIGVSLFFVWRFRGWRGAYRPIATLLVPLAAVVGSALVYLACISGSETLFQSLLVFPLRYYSAGYANSFDVYFDEWQGIFPIHPYSFLLVGLWCAENAAVPIIFVAFIARQFRKSVAVHDSQQNEALALYAVAGIVALLTVARAPSAPRLSCAAVFAYILAAAMLQELGLRRVVRGTLVFAGALALGEMTVAARRPIYILNGPRGPAALLHREDYEAYSWLAAYTHPGERLFGDIAADFVLALRNPAKIQWVEPDAYTRPEQVRELVLALEQQPTQIIIWSEELPPNPNWQDNLQPFRVYVKEHYHVLFDGVWVKSAGS